MLQAVCALISNTLETPNGYTVVSRKKNHALVGLPGGKIEDGENHIEALIREMTEELDIHPDFTPTSDQFKLVFEALCKGDTDGIDYYVYTYKYIGDSDFINVDPPFTQFINNEGALVRSATIEELCDPLASTFHVYNTALKQALGL